MTEQKLTARIEVFRPGTFQPMGGDPITYSAADLRAIADAYDPQTAPAPVVIGHPAIDAPAYGWIEKFDFDPTEGRLVATLHQVEPQFAEMVRDGRFRKVSMAFFGPQQSNNPTPGAWYPKHLGFLGAAAPAVSGLRNAQFAGEAGVTFTASFGEPGFEETASLLRSIRDFFIERFGLDSADKVLPVWRLEWLGEMQISAPTGADPASAYPVFAGGSPAKPNPNEENSAVNPQSEAAFADREAQLSEREQRISAREAAAAHSENAAFADRMVEEGRLLPVLRDRVVALFNALPGHSSVAFAEGEARPAGAVLREILEAQPQVVSYGQIEAPGAGAETAGAAFAADGQQVSAERLKIHAKAEAYMKANPGTDYITAVKSVSA